MVMFKSFESFIFRVQLLIANKKSDLHVCTVYNIYSKSQLFSYFLEFNYTPLLWFYSK